MLRGIAAAIGIMVAGSSFAESPAVLDLSGVWRLEGESHACNARVPGGVHDALLEAGFIDDIYWGSNETNALWVSRRDWTFYRTFEVGESFLGHKDIVLQLEDCDTFCTIAINGRIVGKTSDRFSRFVFPVKEHLKAGINTIVGIFRSPVVEADRRSKAYGRAYPMGNPIWAKNQALIRKPACHGGWDWGPEVETMGFCSDVKLIAFNSPRIEYVYTQQHFTDDLSHCTLDVFADLSDGTTVTNRIEIDNPPLWWPNGMGERKFYDFTVDVNGEKVSRRIGLRKLEVLNERTVSPDGKEGLSLVFSVNNRRLFAKGANWIPCDALESRQTPDRYRDLLESAVKANMNMIRVWGGGQYEKDVFYDLCDELGLLVWHDMMCACAAYPDDEAFLGEIKGELSHQLRRLCDHASIALWCGDNECLGAINWYDETKADLDFYRNAWINRSRFQGEMVAKFDPERTYWPSSPCCGPGDFGDAWKDDSKGDMHQWDVWHENEPFERYYDYHPRFCSEFGYQSFPSPSVAATFSNGPGDDFEWHQKNEGGNKRIRETMLRYFGRAKDFKSELLLSQFQQAMAIKMAVDAWRADMPRCMGTLYWQLNDNWPVASWSSIEYGGKWKPLHYAAKRFYEPIHVVAKPDGSVWGVNDTLCELSGELTVEYWAYYGMAPMKAEVRNVTLAPGAATMIPPSIAGEGAHKDLFAVLELKTSKGTSVNQFHFSKYVDAPLEKANIDLKVNGFEVTLSSDRPAFFVWLDVPGMSGEFDDNALTLLPSRPVTVRFNPKDLKSATPEEFRSLLTVKSLTDLLSTPHSSGEQVGVSCNFSFSLILDIYLPGMLDYFVNGGARPRYPVGVLVESGEALPPEGSTEHEQVIVARKGQGIYREGLLAKWNGACAVTGLAVPELLMASHAKPWKRASNVERLDGNNGLPLVPNLDKLFDKGYISFADDGAVMISPDLSSAACGAFGVDASMHLLKPLSAAQQTYMAYHRNHFFKKG